MSIEKDNIIKTKNLLNVFIHKLNNNLGVLRLDVGDILSESDKLDPKTILTLERIQNSIESALSIPTLFSTLVQTIDHKDETINLYILLNDIIKENKSHDVSFIFDDLKFLPPLKANKFLVKEIFDELLNNAYKAMPKGGKIYISGKLLNLYTVEIRIRDTGCGIEDERITDLFNFGYSNWKRKNISGMGYGLALIKTMIDSMVGAKITFNKDYKEGAEFLVELPISLDKNKKRILVVEDEIVWANRIKHILQNSGYSVHVANDYKTAIDLIESQPFNFATIDLNLDANTLDVSKSHGLKLLDILNESTNYPIPVMVITGFSEGFNKVNIDKNYPNIHIMPKNHFDKDELKRFVTDTVESINEINKNKIETKSKKQNEDNFDKLRLEFISGSVLLALILITSFLYFLLSNAFPNYSIQLNIVFSIIIITLLSILIKVFKPNTVKQAFKIFKFLSEKSQ